MAISSTMASSAFLMSSRRIGSTPPAVPGLPSVRSRSSVGRGRDDDVARARRVGPYAPGGTSVVASYSSMSSGPGRAPRRGPPRPMTGVGSSPWSRPNQASRDAWPPPATSGRPASGARERRFEARGQAQVDQTDGVGPRRVAVGPLVLRARTPRSAGRCARPASPDGGTGSVSSYDWPTYRRSTCRVISRSAIEVGTRQDLGRLRPPWPAKAASTSLSVVDCKGPHERPDQVVLQVRLQQPDGAEDARGGRHDDLPIPRPGGHLGREQGAVATERDDGELTRVATTLDGHGPHGACHPGAAQEIDAMCGRRGATGRAGAATWSWTACRASPASSRRPLGSRSSWR